MSEAVTLLLAAAAAGVALRSTRALRSWLDSSTRSLRSWLDKQMKGMAEAATRRKAAADAAKLEAGAVAKRKAAADAAKAEADAAAKKKAEADAAAKNPVSIKLEEHGLTQYADALGEQGYTSMASFKNMTSEEAGALADEVKMKPGHKRSFIRAFT